MAGNLPVPQGVEIKLVWGKSGIPFALNILHATHPVGQLHSQTIQDALSSAIKTQLTSSGLAGLLHTAVSLMRVESRHMDSNSDPWLTTSTAAVPGTGTGDPLPAQVSFVVTLQTGLRGRSYNGRVYLTGYTEGVSDTAGQITTAAADSSAGFLAGVRGAIAAAPMNMTMGVLTRWTTPPGSPPSTPPTERNPPAITPVSAVIYKDQRWDTQRRRATPGI